MRRPVKSEINRENAAYILRKPDAELLQRLFHVIGQPVELRIEKIFMIVVACAA